jgi:predicted NUDIX family phosphoesterase
MKVEDVMVVKTIDIKPLLGGRTFDLIRDTAKQIIDVVDRAHFFILRADAEVSPQFRQVIPYVVVTHGDDVFTLRRMPKQSEARLHHKVSIGVGGHINPGNGIVEGLRQELDEEIAIANDYDLQFAGIINDETTDVGRVHLGLVYLLRSSGRNVAVRETEKMTGEWLARRGLAPLRDSMESWSQIVYDALLA